MKILIVGLTENREDLEREVGAYYTHFRADFTCDFLSFCEKCCFDDAIKSHGDNIFYVPKKSEKPLRSKFRLRKFFKTHNDYDIVWTHKLSLESIDEIKYAKKFTKAKIIVHGYGTHHKDEREEFSFGTLRHAKHRKKIAEVSDKMLAVCKQSAEFMFGKSNERKVKILHKSIDTERFRFKAEEARLKREELKFIDKTVYGTVSDLNDNANLTFLLEVFRMINLQDEQAAFLIVGEGEKRAELEARAAELALTDKIKFLEDRGDVNVLMEIIDVFFWTSVAEEGYPPVTVQAFSTGASLVIAETESRTPPDFSQIKLLKDFDVDAYVKAAFDAKIAPEDRKNAAGVVAEHGFDVTQNAYTVEDILEELNQISKK